MTTTIVMICLLVMGVFLILLELVVPGGILGGIGAVLILVGIGVAFKQGLVLGASIAGGAIIFFVLAFWAWLKYLPKLPITNQMFMKETAGQWSGANEQNLQYLGKEGVTQTILRPSGFATIDGERVDVVTQGDMIEKGERIKVIEIEGNRIVVETIHEEKDAKEAS